MMKTTLKENILTVVTPITKAVADKALSEMAAYDEEGNQVCKVSFSKNGVGSISSLGLTCNSIVDGKLAVVMVLPMGTTMDDIKKLYGKDLVQVKKYIGAVAEGVEAEMAAVNDLFEE